MHKLAHYLKLKRKSKGLTQRSVAEYLGYGSPQLISNWERGLCAPPSSKLKSIAKFYGISKNEFSSILIDDYKSNLKKVFEF